MRLFDRLHAFLATEAGAYVTAGIILGAAAAWLLIIRPAAG